MQRRQALKRGKNGQISFRLSHFCLILGRFGVLNWPVCALTETLADRITAIIAALFSLPAAVFSPFRNPFEVN
jgi:hypothetical protein